MERGEGGGGTREGKVAGLNPSSHVGQKQFSLHSTHHFHSTNQPPSSARHNSQQSAAVDVNNKHHTNATNTSRCTLELARGVKFVPFCCSWAVVRVARAVGVPSGVAQVVLGFGDTWVVPRTVGVSFTVKHVSLGLRGADFDRVVGESFGVKHVSLGLIDVDVNRTVRESLQVSFGLRGTDVNRAVGESFGVKHVSSIDFDVGRAVRESLDVKQVSFESRDADVGRAAGVNIGVLQVSVGLRRIPGAA